MGSSFFRNRCCFLCSQCNPEETGKNAALDGAGIAADTAALLLPVPGGVGAARNAGKVGKVAAWVNRSKWIGRGTNLVRTSTRAKNVVRAAQLANLGANVFQTVESGSQAYKKWQESCNGEIPLGEIVQTVFIWIRSIRCC